MNPLTIKFIYGNINLSTQCNEESSIKPIKSSTSRRGFITIKLTPTTLRRMIFMIKTLKEFQFELEKLHFFGECKLNVSKTNDGEFKIEVLDYEKYDLLNPKGEMVEKDCESTLLHWVFYADENGRIDVVEHGYSIFTKANANDVAYIVSFIGKRLCTNELEEMIKVN